MDLESEFGPWVAAIEGPTPLLSLRASVAARLASGMPALEVHGQLEQFSDMLYARGREPEASVVDEVIALMDGWGPDHLLLDTVQPAAL